LDGIETRTLHSLNCAVPFLVDWDVEYGEVFL